MSLDFTEAPTLPSLSDPETFNDRALNLFSWLTGDFIPELEAITADDLSPFADGSASAPSITNVGDTNTGFFFPAGDQVAVTVGGSEAMRVTSTGLGIGVSDPDESLEVFGNVKLKTSADYSGYWSTAGAIFSEYGFVGSSGAFAMSIYSNGFRNGSGGFTYLGLDGNTNTASGIDLEPDGDIVFRGGTASGVSLPERARITANGEIGIGTSNPQDDLHIAASNDPAIRLQGTGAGYAKISGDNGALILQADDGNDVAGSIIAFQIDDDEKARFNASGELGIGTTNPVDDIHIVSSSDPAIRFENAGSGYAKISGDSGNLILQADDGSDVANTRIQFQTDNIERARIIDLGMLVGTTNSAPGLSNTENGAAIRSSGNSMFSRDSSTAVLANRNGSDGSAVSLRKSGTQVGSISVTGSATTYNTSSDRRLKSDISDLTGFSARIDALQPCSFTMGGETAQGFIADEFQEVYPNSVTGTPDGEEMQSMQASTSEVMADLIAEIQSLRARVAALEAG